MSTRSSQVWIGTSAGLFAGMTAGASEALVLLSVGGTGEYRALLIGSFLYASLGIIPGLLLGLLAEGITRLAGWRLPPERVWTLQFLGVGTALGQGILEALRPLFRPLSPLVDEWWLAWTLIGNGGVWVLVLWLMPVFVARTGMRRVLKPRGSLTLFGAVLVLAALFAAAPGQEGSPGDMAPPRPVAMAPPGSVDVVLIVVDGLRADHLGSYGSTSELTPALDELAQQSLRFDRVVSQATATAPAMASLMTAMLPTAHGCTQPDCRLSAGHSTLAEVLREHGYATSMVANHRDVGSLSGIGQGFDYYQESPPDPVLEGSRSADGLLWLGVVYRAWERHRTTPRAVGHYYRPAALVLEELKQLVGANRDRRNRFFTVAHIMEPHSPFFDWQGEAVTGEARGPLWTFSTEETELERIRAFYAAEIMAADREIGRFLEWMKTEEGLDQTVLIVAGVQGQSLGEHGRLWEGASVYDEAVRVPLLIRFPDAEFAGMEAGWQVRLMDLAPTISVLAGATRPVSWQGKDLLDGRARDGIQGILEAEEGPLDRSAVTELDLEFGRLQAYRSADWTYIRSCGPESTLDQGRSGCAPVPELSLDELYRWGLDAEQENNLLGQQGQLQSELSGALRRALEDAEVVSASRAELMDSIHGCEDCQAMEAAGRILDCSAFCGDP